MVIAGYNTSCNVPRIKLTSVHSCLTYLMRKIVFRHLQVKPNFHFQIGFFLAFTVYCFHAKQHGCLVDKIFFVDYHTFYFY